jgi:hypothetical protein
MKLNLKRCPDDFLGVPEQKNPGNPGTPVKNSASAVIGTLKTQGALRDWHTSDS